MRWMKVLTYEGPNLHPINFQEPECLYLIGVLYTYPKFCKVIADCGLWDFMGKTLDRNFHKVDIEIRSSWWSSLYSQNHPWCSPLWISKNSISRSVATFSFAAAQHSVVFPQPRLIRTQNTLLDYLNMHLQTTKVRTQCSDLHIIQLPLVSPCTVAAAPVLSVRK